MSSIPLITGATHVLKIKPNNSYIPSTLASVDNLFDVANLSASKFSAWKSVASSAVKVGVVADSSGSEVNRYIDANYSIAGNTGSLWFTGEAQQDKFFYLQTGTTLNKSNSSTVFTDQGILASLGFNEASGSLSNRSGAAVTDVSGFTYGVAATLGDSIQYDTRNSYADINNGTEYNGKTTWTTTALCTTTGLGTYQLISYRYGSAVDLVIGQTAGVFLIKVTAASTASFPVAGIIVNNVQFMLQIIYDGSGVTNADKLKCYVNGNQIVLSFAGAPVPSSIASISSPAADYFMLGDDVGQAWIGTMDEYRSGAYAANTNEPLWRYNQWINQSNYWTVTVQPVITGITRIGYRRWQITGSGFKPESTDPTVTISGFLSTVESGATDTSFIVTENNNTPAGVKTFVITNSDSENDSGFAVGDSDVRVVLNYQGATGGGTPTGHSRFTSRTQAEMAKTVVPVGYANRYVTDIDFSRGVGGCTLYADVNGKIIKSSTFENLVADTTNQVTSNLVDMVDDNILLVQAFGATSGATGGGPMITRTLTSSEMLGFTGGILG